jgi:uncharacterized protein YcbX
MNSPAFVSAINLFPVRSCAGADLDQAVVTPHGLLFDRQWRLVSETGEFLTQRECPKMALVRPSVVNSELFLDFLDARQLHVAAGEPHSGLPVRRVSSDCYGTDQGDEAADWLTCALGVKTRLLRLNNDNAELDFTRPDMSPLLVISEESLADLNSRLGDNRVSMNRFRPNIVVRGVRPYEEDTWERVYIGDVLYEAWTEPCGRCAMVNIDQEKGEKAGKEPLKTLATYRRSNGVVLFGKYMVAVTPGYVRVNDSIRYAD